MSNWYRRLIYYEPEREAADLSNGSMYYLGDGVLSIEYGNIRLLANTCWPGEDQHGRLGRGHLDAVLLPALEPVEPPTDGRLLDPDIPVITPPGLVDAVERFGFRNIHYLDAWHQIVLRKGDASITITALPARRPEESDERAMDNMLEFRSHADASPYRAYVCNGAVPADALEEIAMRYPRIDLAIVSLGYSRIADAVVSFNTKQAVDVVQRTRSGMTIPIHRFDDVFTWPLRDFQQAMCRSSRRACVRLVPPGTSHAFTVSSRSGGDLPMLAVEQGMRGALLAGIAGS